MPSFVVVRPQIKEKQRGGGGGVTMCSPSLMVPKDLSLIGLNPAHLDK